MAPGKWGHYLLTRGFAAFGPRVNCSEARELDLWRRTDVPPDARGQAFGCRHSTIRTSGGSLLGRQGAYCGVQTWYIVVLQYQAKVVSGPRRLTTSWLF